MNGLSLRFSSSTSLTSVWGDHPIDGLGSTRVTNGLGDSPNRVAGRYLQVLASELVIVSTGAMLTVGHEAAVTSRDARGANQELVYDFGGAKHFGINVNRLFRKELVFSAVGSEWPFGRTARAV
jgi:hypothetical protein